MYPSGTSASWSLYSPGYKSSLEYPYPSSLVINVSTNSPSFALMSPFTSLITSLAYNSYLTFARPTYLYIGTEISSFTSSFSVVLYDFIPFLQSNNFSPFFSTTKFTFRWVSGISTSYWYCATWTSWPFDLIDVL